MNQDWNKGLKLDTQVFEKTKELEKGRKSVYKNIRSAIKNIKEEIPSLGAHLDKCISTGGTCCYKNWVDDIDNPVEWVIKK